MAGSLNKVTLIGNVGRDPEIRSMSDGREVASLTLATSEQWRDKASGEKKERTEWHRVAVFSEPLVGVIKNYVKKGSKIYIEGSLQTRKWNDQSGIERYTTEIVLQNFGSSLIMLDSLGKDSYTEETSHRANNEKPKATFSHSELDDEIPF